MSMALLFMLGGGTFKETFFLLNIYKLFQKYIFSFENERTHSSSIKTFKRK